MDHYTFSLVAGTVFSLVTLLHVTRLLFSWKVTIHHYSVPIYFSWIGVLLAGYLAYSAFVFAGVL